jgi:glycosyltransferase involved in cell wall biosynthesis
LGPRQASELYADFDGGDTLWVNGVSAAQLASAPPALFAQSVGYHSNEEVRYWREHVEPLVDGRCVRWVGTVGGAVRDELGATADAALVPISWDEPGSTAVVEALALVTPVVGYRRGCLPELVEHGRTGLLVDCGDEDALASAVCAAARLDPRECRRVAATRFTPARMGDRYMQLYTDVPARRSRAGLRTGYGPAREIQPDHCAVAHSGEIPPSLKP